MNLFVPCFSCWFLSIHLISFVWLFIYLLFCVPILLTSFVCNLTIFWLYAFCFYIYIIYPNHIVFISLISHQHRELLMPLKKIPFGISSAAIRHEVWSFPWSTKDPMWMHPGLVPSWNAATSLKLLWWHQDAQGMSQDFLWPSKTQQKMDHERWWRRNERHMKYTWNK